MTNTENILQDITSVGQRVFRNPAIVMTEATVAKDVPEWDSINHIALIAGIEEHFKIKFTLKEVMKFRDVGDMCKTIRAKLGG